MNELQKVFDYQGKQVRTVVVNSEPHFVAKDVCEILEFSNHNETLKRLDDDEKGVSSIDTLGGKQEVVVVNETGLYSLVLGSRKPEAKQFKRWITHDVLPSIRRTGSYNLAIPKTLPEALRAYATEVECHEKTKLQLAQAEPHILFSKSVQASDQTILIGELAKILKQNGVEIGQNRLFEWMRKNGYLISRKGSDYNMPTQRSMELGLFTIKETTINHSDGHISVSKTAKVTGKGSVYFVNKFLAQQKIRMAE